MELTGLPNKSTAGFNGPTPYPLPRCRASLFVRSLRLAKRFNVRDNLPALRFRQLGPDGHAAADHAVGEDPEKCSGGRGLNFFGAQTRSLPSARGRVPMTFRAMLLEQLLACQGSVRIVCERIALATRLLWNSRELLVMVVMAVVFLRRGRALALSDGE